MPAPRQPIEVREFPRPDLPPGGALLRTERSEVCGTDAHVWHGRLSGVPYPIIPGHVSAGTLASLRGCVNGLDGSIMREGDRALSLLERYAADVSWREIGGRTYPLTAVNEALADAEAMRIPKALVDPWSQAPSAPTSPPSTRPVSA
jgi:NADPH:quinone reductase-like Zn-dependent oxidoreductase